MSKNNVLITGCAGFIGSHYLDLLLQNGHKVIGVDSMTYASKLSNFEHHMTDKNFEFHKADICRTMFMIALCEIHEIDYIINFAAETHVDNSILGGDCFINSNVSGVKSLMEVCKRLEIPICHISTDEVYGPIKQGSFSEYANLSPKNYYSATKAAAEHIVSAYANTFKVPYTMVRMSNNYGPRQHDEKFLPTILRSIKQGTKIPLYGDGKQVRDWIFVKDSVNIIYKILEEYDRFEEIPFSNQVYNVSLRDEKQNKDVIQSVLSLMNLEWDDHVRYVEDRLGHDVRYSIHNEKIGDIIESIDTTSFENGLRRTIQYYE
jgi:dTDP-glucose 4,6-dehydratase